MHMFNERSDEWLKFRKQYISATEAASLLGVNSYLTANKLLQEKLSDDFNRLDNMHMRDGRAAESMVFALLEEAGWHLEKLSPKGKALVFTDDTLCLSSTPDNFRWDERAVVEVKKTTKHNFERNWMGTCPPLRYLSQVQIQMHTTEFDKGFLVCATFEDDVPISIYEVTYSRKYMNLVYDNIIKFEQAKEIGHMAVSTATKQEAASILKKTYKHLGVFRYGGLQANSLEEIFND